MNKRKWSKFVLLFAVVTLTLIGFQQSAFCHGGGGGGDGEQRDQFSNLASYQGAATTLLSELSYDEIKGLMHGLNADVRSMLLDDYSTWPPGTTVKQLIGLIDTGVPVSRLTEKERDSLLVNLDEEIRNYLLNDWEHWTKDIDVADLKGAIERWQAMPAGWADVQDKETKILEAIDWVGEKAQTILGYCPGIGLATAVILDTVRAGANARKDGKNTSEIAGAAAVKGTISFVFNYYSKADEILDTATEGAIDIAVYLGVKEAEAQAGSALEKSANITATDIEHMEIAATFVNDMVYGMPTRENRVTQPTYTSSTGYGPGQTHQTQHTAQ